MCLLSFGGLASCPWFLREPAAHVIPEFPNLVSGTRLASPILQSGDLFLRGGGRCCAGLHVRQAPAGRSFMVGLGEAPFGTFSQSGRSAQTLGTPNASP